MDYVIYTYGTINNKVTIKESDSYAGKAKTKLKGFAVKVREQTAELTTFPCHYMFPNLPSLM